MHQTEFEKFHTYILKSSFIYTYVYMCICIYLYINAKVHTHTHKIKRLSGEKGER
jgi:hypothetical protein